MALFWDIVGIVSGMVFGVILGRRSRTDGGFRLAVGSRKDAAQQPISLEEREKIVITLLVHEGMTASEIAQVLGIPREIVGEILRGIVQKLKHV
jgi:DNA-binding NarL/FixJ family response regulator